MEPSRDGIEASKEASYSVIVYRGNELPKRYYNMVLSKWMRTLKYGNDYFKLADSDDYFQGYTVYIESILKKSATIIRLAVLSDEVDTVLGWSVNEGPALHYVWVDGLQRNQGIARALVPQVPSIITHLTKSGISIWSKKLPLTKFKPFFKGAI